MVSEPQVSLTAKIWRDEEGIVHVESSDGAEESLETARANVQITLGLHPHDRPARLIIDIRRLKSIDQSARRFYAESRETKNNPVAIALVGSNVMSRLLANFVIGTFSRSKTKLRLFGDEADARAWLRSFVP